MKREQTLDMPQTPSPEPGFLAKLARASIRRRRTVLVGWVAAVIAISAIASATGTDYSENIGLEGTESQQAVDLLEADFPEQSGDQDQVVFAAKDSSVTSPAIREQIGSALAEIAEVPNVAAVVSPFSGQADNSISQDGGTAFATVTFDQEANTVPLSSVERVIEIAEGARSPQLQVELGGAAIEQTQISALGTETVIGLAAAVIVLLIMFGSLAAMGIPILTALLGLGAGVSLIGISTQLLDIVDFTTQLAIMIGLGVGIDYALFIVTRFRESYRDGADVNDAVVEAMDTAGRAVLFAGVTVIIALMGMFALGISLLNGLAIGASITVLLTLLTALTLLPVLLSFFGKRVGRQRQRPGAAQRADRPTALARWAGVVQRNPWPALVVSSAVMLLLAVPALSLRLGSSDAGNGSEELTTTRSYNLLAEGFGKGFNGPLQVVASSGESQLDEGTLSSTEAALKSTPGVASVDAPTLSPDQGTAVFQVYPDSAPQDAATTDLVERLRDETLPSLASSNDETLLVGGQTANQVDFSKVLSDKLPLFIGIVVLLSALLLLVVFRSLVIPVQAAVMNLLSIGASLGVVVAIFQYGWLDSLLGIEAGPIDAFIPVLLFAIVFGLSMDYEVFLVSRIREAWVKRESASEAVVTGISSTGRVITAAATIMITVFASFAIADERVLKLFGIGLATAVFLDAFVIRMLLLPATLQLLGRRTWKLPGGLDRFLPHLAIDAPPPVAKQVATTETR